MANELTLNLSVAFVKGSINHRPSVSKLRTISGSVIMDQVQIVGTTEEAVDIGDVAAPGYMLCENQDATNYVQIGAEADHYAIKLQPGDIALFPLNGTTPKAKANTEPCNVRFLTLPL